MHRCETCKRHLSPGPTGRVCDWCSGVRVMVPAAHGWILWAQELAPEGEDLYVFPSREMAEYFQRCTGTPGVPRLVLSHWPMGWIDGRGTVRNLRLARRVVRVFPDHRFEPGPYRAYLAPEPRAWA